MKSMSDGAYPIPNETGMSDEVWPKWQREVLTVIRTDFRCVLDRVDWDDIDWDAWRPLYDRGCTPHEAVHSAFGRVA